MEETMDKGPCAPVNTGTERFWESERLGRIINLLPEDGCLAIRRCKQGWEVECRIDGQLLLKGKTQEPGGPLRYIEDLLRILKGLEGEA